MVDFGASTHRLSSLLPRGSMPTAGEDDVKLVSAMAEIVEKVDVSLLSFDEKMQAWLVDARPMVRAPWRQAGGEGKDRCKKIVETMRI